MTQIELLDTIRNEIERRIKNWHCTEFVDEMREGPNGDDGLLAFLDTLNSFADELIPSLPSDVDEAAEKYADGPECTWVGASALKCAFKAGAEWMAGKMK